jgi:hypothetical protein
MIQNDLIATVDQLADIRSQIKALENQEVKLRSTLVNSGVSTILGNLNVAVIENYLQSLVNWQKIARDLKATQQKIAGNTRKDIRWRVRIKPRVLQ